MSDDHAGLGLSAIAAALPVLVYLIVIWRLDRYEREPLWLVGLTFLYGAIGAIILGLVLSIAVMVTAGTDDLSITAGVIAPICEETFFRGMLFGGLRRRMPPIPAALISGLVFGGLHAATGVSAIPVLVVFGVVLALVYERTRSLVPGMILHAFNNTLALL